MELNTIKWILFMFITSNKSHIIIVSTKTCYYKLFLNFLIIILKNLVLQKFIFQKSVMMIIMNISIFLKPLNHILIHATEYSALIYID